MPDRHGADTPSITVRPASPDDGAWVGALLRERWGATHVARRGRLDDASSLPCVIAMDGGRRCGLATYRREGDGTELVTLDAVDEHRGIGTALVRALARQEGNAGVRRIWLVTTNDNLEALRFYQRRGLRLVAIHPGAVIEARRLKPTIPVIGRHGIEIRDELVLELDLQPGTDEEP